MTGSVVGSQGPWADGASPLTLRACGSDEHPPSSLKGRASAFQGTRDRKRSLTRSEGSIRGLSQRKQEVGLGAWGLPEGSWLGKATSREKAVPAQHHAAPLFLRSRC